MNSSEKKFAKISFLIASVGISILYGIPSIFIFLGSFFYTQDLGHLPVFIGFNNFFATIKDYSFWSSLFSSVVFTFLSVAGQIVVAFGAALLTYRKFRGVEALRWILLSPYFFPTIVVVIAWHFFTEPSVGIFTVILKYIGYESIDFRSPSFALPAMIIVSTYEAFPFCYAVFLARLLQIPRILYNVAQLDGANSYKIFTTITWPQIRVLLLGMIALRFFITALKFDVPWLVYAARAESKWSETVAVWLYRTAFERLHGEQAFAATVLFLIIGTVISYTVYSLWKYNTGATHNEIQ